MSAPTPPNPPHDRTEWLAPRPGAGPAAPARRPALPVRRSRSARVVDVVARVGTAVTLVALMVLTGTALAMLDSEPVPTGATTTGATTGR